MANLTDIGYGVGKYLEASDASGIPAIGTNRTNLDLLNFKVATNNAYALYNFKDGMIDAYQTEAGVDTGTSTNETYDSTNKLYSPIVVAAATTAFTSTGASTYTCPAGITQAEILIVAAGGGGAGYYMGGGGGSGGIVHDTDYVIVPTIVYDLTIGAGGGGGGATTDGTTGSDTVFNVNAEGSGLTLTAKGGGGGRAYGAPDPDGLDGGSGGGSSAQFGNTASAGSGGSSIQASFSGATSYGNTGGGNITAQNTEQAASGGGGAGEVGNTDKQPINNEGGAGGDGLLFSNFTSYGVSGYFGGGGGGGGGYQGSPKAGGTGGTGGGGNGANYNATAAVAGTVNTGSGGGGGSAHIGTPSTSSGAAGGSGVVIVKTAATTTNMTLLSNAQTAQAAPTEGRLMLYEEDVDSVTLNTDLKGYVSRDGGTTYTQTPLALDSTITHPTSLLLHCDGSNDGVVFTDSSYWNHVPTVSGGTHTDTTVKKFGTASAQFDGTQGDEYLDYPSSPQFGFGTGDWTIDFWVNSPNWSAGSGYGTPFDMRPGANQTGSPRIFFDTGNSNVPGYTDGSSGTKCGSNVVMVNNTWYHIAVVKYNNVTKVYTDGVTGASGTYPVSFADTTNYRTENILRIGDTSVTADPYAFNGYIDEFRITKGIARWTANFTPDTSPYTGTEGDTRLLSGSVDISGQPSGTNMKYKIETLNSKNLKLHGASLLWA
jgi:hypothetical protein